MNAFRSVIEEKCWYDTSSLEKFVVEDELNRCNVCINGRARKRKRKKMVV
jgi:hypothetical protein